MSAISYFLGVPEYKMTGLESSSVLVLRKARGCKAKQADKRYEYKGNTIMHLCYNLMFRIMLADLQFTGFAETAFSLLIIINGFAKLFFAEVRPERFTKI